MGIQLPSPDARGHQERSGSLSPTCRSRSGFRPAIAAADPEAGDQPSIALNPTFCDLFMPRKAGLGAARALCWPRCCRPFLRDAIGAAAFGAAPLQTCYFAIFAGFVGLSPALIRSGTHHVGTKNRERLLNDDVMGRSWRS